MCRKLKYGNTFSFKSKTIVNEMYATKQLKLTWKNAQHLKASNNVLSRYFSNYTVNNTQNIYRTA